MLQDHLGEVVFVDLPELGGSVAQGSSFGAVESVKATSDVNCPISGEIVEVNTKLSETPGLVCNSNLQLKDKKQAKMSVLQYSCSLKEIDNWFTLVLCNSNTLADLTIFKRFSLRNNSNVHD